MTYIENVFVCIIIPLLLILPFMKQGTRQIVFFLVTGMGMCLLSAYVNSFFMMRDGADATIAAVEITPVCEEAMMLLPLLFYFLIFEPEPGELIYAAIAVSAGFATFENVCYLAENGAGNMNDMIIRGVSAGALHILCGVICGLGMSFVFRRRYLALTGGVGIFGFCVGLHAIYNLLVTAGGVWRIAGYLFPSLVIFALAAARLVHSGRKVHQE